MQHFRWLIITLFFCIWLSACTPRSVLQTQPPSKNASLEAAQAYLMRGDQELGTRNYDQAIADYTRAIQTKPDYAEAYNNRGLAYALKSKGQLGNAIADYSQAIILRPAYAYAYNNRGVAFMASGRPEEAFRDFNRAIQLNPGFLQAHSNRGNYYWRSGKYGLGIIDLIQANPVLLGSIVLLCAFLGTVLLFILRKPQGARRRHGSRFDQKE